MKKYKEIDQKRFVKINEKRFVILFQFHMKGRIQDFVSFSHEGRIHDFISISQEEKMNDDSNTFHLCELLVASICQRINQEEEDQ